MRDWTLRSGLTAALIIAITAAIGSAEAATESGGGLRLISNERGVVSLSMDGLGTLSSSGVLEIAKPAGATVRRAVLFAATTGFTGARLSPETPITLDGASVPMGHEIASSIESFNYWADVTEEVRAKLDAAPAGLVEFAVTEPETRYLDGTVLAVVFDDPNVTVTRSVALMYGALRTTGDEFRIGFEGPFTGSSDLEMALGISYGFQGSVQFSTIEVNGQLVTSSAGGQDDGDSANGALITVGGVGDGLDNPVDPEALPAGPRSDDERYDLTGLVPAGATTVSVRTENPSNDDNIFLAAFVGNPPITSITTSGPDWEQWSIGDVHAHAAGDTSLSIHPSCDDLDGDIEACAERLVGYTQRHAARFDTDWLVLTEHAPWLGFRRDASVVLYDAEQGEEQYEAIVRAARDASGSVDLLAGLELGTAAPACTRFINLMPWNDGPIVDSPGHYGVYFTPRFIDDSLFDCSETGSNGYAEDTWEVGGFGGINHPRNSDGGSRWHCWNTSDDSGEVQGDEKSPITLGSQQCAYGIDFYGVAEAADEGAFRTMEIVSGHNLPRKTVLEHWDQLLRNRFRVAAVGGGDGHTAPRKQDLANAASCLWNEPAESVFACFIDRGGRVKDPNVGKVGGSGRTLVQAPRAALGGGVTASDHPVREAIRMGATVATNGPRVLAEVDGVSPGGTRRTGSDRVSVRVDWQATFRHAGDMKGYCATSAEHDGKCPDSFGGVSFEDIRDGESPPAARVSEADPDEVVIVVAPRDPCGRDEGHCQEDVVRHRFRGDDITEDEREARSFVREVDVPAGESYVRVEWYSDTGRPNGENGAYFDDEVWDFGALTSPVFVEREARAAALSRGPTQPGERPDGFSRSARGVASDAELRVAASVTSAVEVLDRYGRPLSGAAVRAFAVDLEGMARPVAAATTSGAGIASLELEPGDHYFLVQMPGCVEVGTSAAVARTGIVHLPAPDRVGLRLDCRDPDRTAPAVRITAGPEGIVPSSEVTFSFEALDDSGQVRTGCLLDRAELDDFSIELCTSPVSYERVGGGQHTFQVIAIDPNGNVSPVATRTFFVATSQTPPPLYRARQVPQGNGNAAPNIVIERNVARAGLGDADPDGDGWAELGSTRSANERGYLDGFELDEQGIPTVLVDHDKPPRGARCYTATADLSPVKKNRPRRLTIVEDPVSHPDCEPDRRSNALPDGGPIYR